MTRRLAAETGDPGPIHRHPWRPSREPRPACPTIDVAEAERRLREDPDRPLLLDVREPNEFAGGPGPRRGAPADVRRSRRGPASCRPTGRSSSSATSGSRSAAVVGFLQRSGRTDVTNATAAWTSGRGPRAHGPAWRGALPATPPVSRAVPPSREPGERRPAAATAERAARMRKPAGGGLPAARRCPAPAPCGRRPSR